jgi:hypothetical protein
MLPSITGGSGGMSFDGGTQSSDAGGGNGTINNGGVYIPAYPAEAFGYPGQGAKSSNIDLKTLLVIGLVGSVVWLVAKKSK